MSDRKQTWTRCRAGSRAVLAAGLYLHMLASAVAARAEELLVFGELPEPLWPAALQAFAEDRAGDGAAGQAPTIAADTIRAAQRDLNGDGSPELLLIREDGAGCVGNACPVRVLQRQGDGWRPIGAFLGNADIIRVYRRRDVGYHRLGNMPSDRRWQQRGVPTVQVWWRDRYWDLLQFNAEADTWPAELLQFRRPTAAERRVIATRTWQREPEFSKPRRQYDRKHNFLVAAIDLNDDGEKELVLATTDPGWCGSGGCHGEIVQRVGRQWTVVGEIAVGSLDRARVLRERHNGYRMLQFMSVVVWTGNEYLEYGEGKNDLDL